MPWRGNMCQGILLFCKFLKRLRCYTLRIFRIGNQQDIAFRELFFNLDLEDVSGGEFAVGEGFGDKSDAEVVAHGGQDEVGGGQLHIRREGKTVLCKVGI